MILLLFTPYFVGIKSSMVPVAVSRLCEWSETNWNKAVQGKCRAAPSSARYSYTTESVCMSHELDTSIPHMWYFAIDSLAIQAGVYLSLSNWSDLSKEWSPWQQRGRGQGMKYRCCEWACPTELSPLVKCRRCERTGCCRGEHGFGADWIVYCRKLQLKGERTEAGDDPYATADFEPNYIGTRHT